MIVNKVLHIIGQELFIFPAKLRIFKKSNASGMALEDLSPIRRIMVFLNLKKPQQNNERGRREEEMYGQKKQMKELDIHPK